MYVYNTDANSQINRVFVLDYVNRSHVNYTHILCIFTSCIKHTRTIFFFKDYFMHDTWFTLMFNSIISYHAKYKPKNNVPKYQTLKITKSQVLNGQLSTFLELWLSFKSQRIVNNVLNTYLTYSMISKTIMIRGLFHF